jgi:hypothetical protein
MKIPDEIVQFFFVKVLNTGWELYMPSLWQDARERKGNKQIRDYSVRINLNYIPLSGSNL